MHKGMQFESERLMYREICAADAEEIVRWRSDPNTYVYFRNPKPLTLKEHLEWYESSYLKDPSRVDFIIVEKESKILIGLVGVSGIDGSTGQISYVIGEVDFLRRGFGAEAVNATVRHFGGIGIYSFYAEIHHHNIASIKTIKKCGFDFEKQLESGFLRYKREMFM